MTPPPSHSTPGGSETASPAAPAFSATPNNSKPGPKPGSIQLVGQGGFGCVYYRGFDSNGIVLPPQYVTKVARLEKSQEIGIGRLISGMPGYEEFFTTVIETEPIDLAVLAPDTVSQCHVIARHVEHGKLAGTAPEFQLLKQLYVPHVTLLDFVKRRGIFVDGALSRSDGAAVAYSIPRFMNVLISCHEHMLMALARMQAETEVVHYDIKVQNVVLHIYTKNPVILDFGLSFSIRDVRKALESGGSSGSGSGSDLDAVLRLKPFFYGYHPDYMAWSIEVHIISYIVNAAHDAAAGTPSLSLPDSASSSSSGSVGVPVLTSEVLAELLNTFIDKHEYLRQETDAFKRAYYERAFRNYTRTAVGKPGLQLIRSYVQGDNWKRWDYYAVATLFLDMTQEMRKAYRASEIEPYQDEISAFCAALKVAGDYVDADSDTDTDAS